MLRLALYISIGWIALAIVFVILWSRMHTWTDEDDYDVFELPALNGPEEADGNALTSVSGSEFEVRRLRKNGPKGFQKRPTDGTAA